ncbi:di-heme oxidoredictase family protein [Litoreibacter janthinus]|uniref:Di-haem oxidoreductase, putative peroxidase n=1 Tax=Litoreibacter janthinus TaxID=670154 RepID=A0A1I6HY09_9RHOB|nr:di-heme oxidoredictase family protein [Litoreibacter janthinus]SFR59356.1 Di-haem oxidoreductase, putative peroxidase [Litoreibacter janthinus]
MRQIFLTALMMSLLPIAAQGDSAPPPVDQRALTQMIKDGEAVAAFLEAFEAGDKLTEFSFGADQGVGAYIGEGRRFTRFPRADLKGPMEWASHFPKREGGANATSCVACHNAPFANGAGDIALNVVVDPAHSGDPSQYLERNTLPLFALGIPQRLAEEITTDLYLQRDAARQAACSNGKSSAKLSSKGVDYGTLILTRTRQEPCTIEIDSAGLKGIDSDLVIKPFGWKGNHSTIRAFTRGAAHNELGLQAVELVGDQDGDFDGVTDELTVGDMTALTTYMAALERPVSKMELADLNLIELSAQESSAILAGEQLFADAGCASCHTPSMPLQDTVFREPSVVAGFFDVAFPDGSDPQSHGFTQTNGMAFDLNGDQPNNVITLQDGAAYHLGALEMDGDGQPTARWFTDFKRHDMGPELADPSDPLGLGASKFLTRSLAGVGATGPWLHDGRATSLKDAIISHGGDAKDSAVAFKALQPLEQGKLVSFLESLTMFQNPKDN